MVLVIAIDMRKSLYLQGFTANGLLGRRLKLNFVLFLKTKKDAGNPIVLYYNLNKPIERDLTPSEIQAYQELTTYAGTTIVENDADCYMEVSAVVETH